MPKTIIWLRRALAAATVALALLMCLQCIAIYLDGSSAADTAAAPLFSVEKVSARIRALIPAFVCYAALAVVTIIAQSAYRPPESAPAVQPMKPEKTSGFRMPTNAVRALLLAAAAVFIVLGVINGGLRDVLIKAINICTECIGLG